MHRPGTPRRFAPRYLSAVLYRKGRGCFRPAARSASFALVAGLLLLLLTAVPVRAEGGACAGLASALAAGSRALPSPEAPGSQAFAAYLKAVQAAASGKGALAGWRSRLMGCRARLAGWTAAIAMVMPRLPR